MAPIAQLLKEELEEAVEVKDKRFEDVNRRFTMMFTFMSVGFTGLAVLMSLFKFLVP